MCPSQICLTYPWFEVVLEKYVFFHHSKDAREAQEVNALKTFIPRGWVEGSLTQRASFKVIPLNETGKLLHEVTRHSKLVSSVRKNQGRKVYAGDIVFFLQPCFCQNACRADSQETSPQQVLVV